jgi:hypothetical protein
MNIGRFIRINFYFTLRDLHYFRNRTTWKFVVKMIWLRWILGWAWLMDSVITISTLGLVSSDFHMSVLEWILRTKMETVEKGCS